MHKLVSSVNKRIVPSKLTFDNGIQINTKKERSKNRYLPSNFANLQVPLQMTRFLRPVR